MLNYNLFKKSQKRFTKEKKEIKNKKKYEKLSEKEKVTNTIKHADSMQAT